MRQTDYVILGLLSEQPLSGYQIKKIVDIRFKFFWSESFGQIFPALKALAAEGLIEEISARQPDARAQRLYRILPSGQQALADWLKLPVEKESLRLEILLKTYFSNLVAPETMLEHLAAFEESHRQQLHLLGLFRKELEALIDADENHREILRVIDFGEKANRAYLDWCRETTDYYKQKQLAQTGEATKE